MPELKTKQGQVNSQESDSEMETFLL